MDLNDLATQADYIADRQAAAGGKEEYNKKYTGLNHLFFDKTRLLRDLEEIGFRDLQFFDHKTPSGTSEFRFNLLAKK